jgi:hypothetical protein
VLIAVEKFGVKTVCQQDVDPRVTIGMNLRVTAAGRCKAA